MASLWKRIKDKAKSTYQKVDSRLGGYLPGGVTPSQAKSGGSTTQQQTGGSSGGSPQNTSSGSGSSSSNTSSGSSSSGRKSSGGGQSRINPITKQPEYVLPSGAVVPVNEQTTNAIVSGKSDFQVSIVGQTSGGSRTDSLAKQTGSLKNVSSSQGSQSLVNQSSSNQSSLGQKISSLENKPLGTPTATTKQGLVKQVFYDTVDRVSGQTGGVWLSHFGRPTGMSADEIKREFKESTTTGVKKILSPRVLTNSPLSIIQEEWGQSAKEIRESGRITEAKQKSQIKSIEQVSREVDDLTKAYSGDFTTQDYIDMTFKKKDVKLSTQDRVDLMFGKKTALDLDKSKKNAPGVQAKQFEKDADLYLKEVEKFNAQFGGKELTPDVYNIAVKEKTRLDSQRESLTAKQGFLTKAYEDYEAGIVSKVGNLRNIGVETKVDGKGNIVFSSKELDKKVAPVGFKLQKDFMKDDKITWKNIAYGGGAIAHTTAEAVAIGFITGGTGVVAKIGAGVSKLPKIIQTGIKIGSVGLAVGGVASKGYSGYKLAEQVEIPKWYGATLGTTIGLGQTGGFVAGGYLGTKAYYSGVQDKILAGKYTKSVAEIREGTLIVDKTGTTKGGFTRQMGIYETKVKGTDWNIKSNVKLGGQYGKDFGQSDVKIVSQFTGKSPKGVPKTWATQGKTLESGDWLKFRTFTKSGKGKVWYEQDYLAKRTMLDRLKVDVSQSRGFEGYNELERLKFLTSIKSVGKPVKVGKVLPKDVWKADEIFRFQNWKGQGKAMQPWEFGEAKSDSIFGTKQYVLYKNAKPGSTTIETANGNIKILSQNWGTREFQSIGKSSGVSAEFLKQQLKDSIIVIKQPSLSPMGKRGSVNLFSGKPQTTTQLPKVTTKPQMTNPIMKLDSSTLLKIQLQKVVPGLISKQFLSQVPTTLALSSGLMGSTQFLETRQTLTNLNKQVLNQRLQQVQIQKAIQQQSPLSQTKAIQQSQQQVQQTQIKELALQTAIISPTITPFPIVPTGIPIIPGFPMPDLYGWGWKEPKETLRGKNSGAYIPDFTAKALGLKPKTLSKAQLKKLLKTDLTGLGVRRGAIPN